MRFVFISFIIWCGMIFSMRLSRLLESHFKYKRMLEANKETPTISAGLKMLSNYFNQYPNADVAIVNPGGFDNAYLLANELDRRNIMIIHPAPINGFIPWKPYCDGEARPHNPLLIIDSESKTGGVAAHVKEHFQEKGYLVEKMSIYLHKGTVSEANWPMLRSLDSLIIDRQRYYALEKAMQDQRTGFDASRLALNY
jgi:hypothetical protein